VTPEEEEEIPSLLFYFEIADPKKLLKPLLPLSNPSSVCSCLSFGSCLPIPSLFYSTFSELCEKEETERGFFANI